MVLILVWPADAKGERGGEVARARALVLAEEAQDAYDDERFDDAVVLLREALELFPAHVLNFNLGLAYEQLGQDEQALSAYERYLDQPEDPPDREGVEQRMTSIRERLRAGEEAEVEAGLEPSESEVPVEPDHPAQLQPPGVGPGPWVLTGLGFALAATGGIFGVLALVERQRAEDDPIQLSAVESVDRSDNFAIVFDVMLPLGGVMVLSGLIWALVSRSRATSAPQVSLSPNGIVLKASWL